MRITAIQRTRTIARPSGAMGVAVRGMRWTVPGVRLAILASAADGITP
jgi:hypothetical protein